MGQQYSNHGRDQINIQHQYGPITIQNEAGPRRSRCEQRLLRKMKHDVTYFLERSLHNAVLINLGKEVQSGQVRCPLDAYIKIGSKPAEPLPEGANILEVFNRPDINGRLLILGKPGSGKTTTLLDLARSLLNRAEEDPEFPIPALFHLSRWRDNRQSIQDWIAAEMSNYNVDKDSSKRLLAEGRLLLMLDGLDELKSERMKPCAQAINQLLASENSPLYLIVCCRYEEYQNVVRGLEQKEKSDDQKTNSELELNGSIVLQELSSKQIQDYLTRVQKEDLWQELNLNRTFFDLMQKPFWLSILILAAPKISTSSWSQTGVEEPFSQKLLNAYIQRMLERPINNFDYCKQGQPTSARTKHWLIHLAKHLKEQSTTEFLIEEMQPEWLMERQLIRIYYILNHLVLGLVTAIIFGLIAYAAFERFLNTLELVFIVLVGFLIGVFNNFDKSINLVEALEWSWKEFFNGFSKGVRIGLFLTDDVSQLSKPGSFYRWGIVAKISHFSHSIAWRIWWITCWLIGLLITGLLGGYYGLNRGITAGSNIERKIRPNQGIFLSAESFSNVVIIWTATISVASVLIGSLIPRSLSQFTIYVLIGTTLGIVLGIFSGLERGGKACIQHFTLRFILWVYGRTPWHYARFLDYCTEHFFLQRVGGRYRFIHKLLQDHFAAMPLDRPTR